MPSLGLGTLGLVQLLKPHWGLVRKLLPLVNLLKQLPESAWWPAPRATRSEGLCSHMAGLKEPWELLSPQCLPPGQKFRLLCVG